MTPLEEANELEALTRKAFFEVFGGLVGSIGYQTPEVRFRYDSIVGMLYMAGKEIEMFIKELEGKNTNE